MEDDSRALGHSYAALRWLAKKGVVEDAVALQAFQARGIPARPEFAALHSEILPGA